MPANTGRENKDVRVTEAMDVFSAGCVIAELFREGAPLFTLSQLFKYREGELSIDAVLASIEDVGVCVSPVQDGVTHSLTTTHCFRISSKI
jgi:phosphoinositide-3-kinase, regulatory subunit 4